MISDALLCDLSAIARHFGVDDRDVLEKYHATADANAAIGDYANRLGRKYPVWTLAKFRALTRGDRGLVNSVRSRTGRADALRHALTHPLGLGSWRLLSAALVRY